MKLFLLTLVFLSLPLTVLAATDSSCPPDAPEGSVCLENPLGSKVTFSDIAGTIIKGALGIIGSLTLLMFVWGGFQWLTSAGNAERVEAGSKTMIWAVIGVLLVFFSYFLISTLTSLLHKGT